MDLYIYIITHKQYATSLRFFLSKKNNEFTFIHEFEKKILQTQATDEMCDCDSDLLFFSLHFLLLTHCFLLL